MATRGRASQPDKGRRGSRAKDDLQAELNPEVPVIPYPEKLPEEQRPYWLETVNAKTADYWSRGDVPLLMLYCRCAADIDRLSKDIDDEGEVIANAKGNMVVNPKLVVRGFAESRLLALASKLRMQPSSRVAPVTESNAKKRKQAASAAAAAIRDSGGHGGLDDGDDGEDGLLAGGLPH